MLVVMSGKVAWCAETIILTHYTEQVQLEKCDGPYHGSPRTQRGVGTRTSAVRWRIWTQFSVVFWYVLTAVLWGYSVAYSGFRIFLHTDQFEFGLKDLRLRTSQMEYFIDDHWSAVLKREKLNDIMLE